MDVDKEGRMSVKLCEEGREGAAVVITL
jgi:hypothetical protein